MMCSFGSLIEMELVVLPKQRAIQLFVQANDIKTGQVSEPTLVSQLGLDHYYKFRGRLKRQMGTK